MYSHKYVLSLKPFFDVICVDPEDFFKNPNETLASLNQCDLVHIQYETSLFLSGNTNRYLDLCAAVRRPLVVTLHEIYDRFPGVFPRDAIRGVFPFSLLRKWLYDRRHPHVTALTKHLEKGFGGRSLLVHAEFQKEILVRKGLRPENIFVFPVPVNDTTKMPPRPWDGRDSLCLAATGFINDSYDFDLLMNALAQCDLPWKFNWIGTVRRPDDEGLHTMLRTEIDRRKWHDRFVITGFVSDEKRDEMLSQTHIYCAFYKYKSSSESLAAAIGAGDMILATSLPITREMTARFPVMLIVSDKPAEIAKAIGRLAIDKDLRASLGSAVTDYCKEFGRQRMARRLAEFYERELSK